MWRWRTSLAEEVKQAVKRKRSKRILEADEFVLKDEIGNRRGVLKMGDHGPVFYLTDDHGDVRLTLSASDHGPYVEFYEPGTQTLVEFGMSDTELHLDCFYGHKRLKARVSLEANADGIAFYDERGRLLCSVPGNRFKPPIPKSPKPPQSGG